MKTEIKEHGIAWYAKRVFNDVLERYTGMHVMNSIPRGSTKFAIEHFNGRRIKVAEIGVYKAYNSRDIIEKLNVEKFYLIDPYATYGEYPEEIKTWMNKAKSESYNRLKKFSKVEKIYLYKFSHDAVDDVKEKIDFIYIDGNHAEKYVYQDIEDYWPLVAKGGILAGHDFNLQDVSRAVYRFANEYGLKVHNLGVDWWFINEVKA